MTKCAIVYSGGTDSTCVAALKSQAFEEIHLLTFQDDSNVGLESPQKNIECLKTHFKKNHFINITLNTNDIFYFLSQRGFIKNAFKHGLLSLSNCLYSSLSWHIKTIQYCKRHEIKEVFDGITNEMTHLPNHTDAFLLKTRAFYKTFDIEYSSPIRDWDVLENRQLVEQIIVNQHDYMFPSEEQETLKTSGQYLYDIGFFDKPNMKGTKEDFRMQQACYPFVLYNIIVFWYYLQFEGISQFEHRLSSLIEDKLVDARKWLEAN